MRIRIPIHPAFLENEETDDQITMQSETSFETSLKQVLKPKEFERLSQVIRKLGNDKEISIQEVMNITKKSRTTAWRYMKVLVDLGVVEATGSTNNVVYTVI